jgi:hypothetical protein
MGRRSRTTGSPTSVFHSLIQLLSSNSARTNGSFATSSSSSCGDSASNVISPPDLSPSGPRRTRGRADRANASRGPARRRARDPVGPVSGRSRRCAWGGPLLLSSPRNLPGHLSRQREDEAHRLVARSHPRRARSSPIRSPGSARTYRGRPRPRQQSFLPCCSSRPLCTESDGRHRLTPPDPASLPHTRRRGTAKRHLHR